MSYTRCLYHIIFRTKYSEQTIPIGPDELLYRYIGGIIGNKNCVVYNINGMPDHIHICASLAANISLSDFVRDIKRSSSAWLKENGSLFPYFRGWAAEFAGLSYGSEALPNLINYIGNPKLHHTRISFKDELKSLLDNENVPYDDRYFLIDKG